MRAYDLWKTRSDLDERGPTAIRRDPPGAPSAAVPPTYDPRCQECGAEVDVFLTVCGPCVEFPLLSTGTGR